MTFRNQNVKRVRSTIKPQIFHPDNKYRNILTGKRFKFLYRYQRPSFKDGLFLTLFSEVVELSRLRNFE
jgi:hypothetical protein